VRFSQHDGRGAEAREREAGFRLGDGQMILFDRGNRTPLTTVHYTAMQSAFISRGPEPRWKAPDGTEVIGKVDPGRFRFLRDRDRDRNWLVVIPQGQQPIVIRLSDAQVRDVVTEFHNRSGLPVQRVGAPQ
jgi:hypothetical protein